ncbi:hypothetical protein K443DRAFT_684941, partial [Laccaria amethystina LaAM-08-1]
MVSVTYGIQAVRVPSGSFNFVMLITFRRPVVTRDRRQTETRLWWSPFGFYVRNRLVAEVY